MKFHLIILVRWLANSAYVLVRQYFVIKSKLEFPSITHVLSLYFLSRFIIPWRQSKEQRRVVKANIRKKWLLDNDDVLHHVYQKPFCVLTTILYIIKSWNIKCWYFRDHTQISTSQNDRLNKDVTFLSLWSLILLFLFIVK